MDPSYKVVERYGDRYEGMEYRRKYGFTNRANSFKWRGLFEVLDIPQNIKEAKASSEEKRNMINLGRCMYGEEGTPFKDFIEDYNFSNK